MKLHLILDSLNNLDSIDLDRVDGIYINFDDLILKDRKKIVDKIKSYKKNVFVMMPYITREDISDKVVAGLKKINEYNIDAISANSLGDIKLAKEYTNKKVFCNYLLNFFNTYSILFLEKLNIKQVTLSPELNLQQIKNIIKNVHIKTECIVAGYIPIIISQKCIFREISNNFTCPQNNSCKIKNFYLKDEKGYKFPVIFNKYCQTVIYNSKILLFTEIENLSSNIRIETSLLSPKQINNLVLFYRNKIEKKKENINIKKIFPDITTGHYFRGVK